MADRLDERLRALGLTREEARLVGERAIAELRSGRAASARPGPARPVRARTYGQPEPRPGPEPEPEDHGRASRGLQAGWSVVQGRPDRRAPDEPPADEDERLLAEAHLTGEFEAFRKDYEEKSDAHTYDMNHWATRPVPRAETGGQHGMRVVAVFLAAKRGAGRAGRTGPETFAATSPVGWASTLPVGDAARGPARAWVEVGSVAVRAPEPNASDEEILAAGSRDGSLMRYMCKWNAREAALPPRRGERGEERGLRAIKEYLAEVRGEMSRR
jgi:hypothetical protein